jgi:DNA modification methylase
MNWIIHADCTEVLKTMPADSVDFVLTDPPYFVRYRDRSGRSLQNDGAEDTAKVLSAFPQATVPFTIYSPDPSPAMVE